MDFVVKWVMLVMLAIVITLVIARLFIVKAKFKEQEDIIK